MADRKQSVFVPCGHRCVCYDCGKKIHETKRKCPICNHDSLYILKKVYD